MGNDGPPGGSSMPGGMPPYFTVSKHRFPLLVFNQFVVSCYICNGQLIEARQLSHLLKWLTDGG